MNPATLAAEMVGRARIIEELLRERGAGADAERAVQQPGGGDPPPLSASMWRVTPDRAAFTSTARHAATRNAEALRLRGQQGPRSATDRLFCMQIPVRCTLGRCVMECPCVLGLAPCSLHASCWLAAKAHQHVFLSGPRAHIRGVGGRPCGCR